MPLPLNLIFGISFRLPEAFLHISNHKILEDDNVFLHAQDLALRRVRSLSHSPMVAREQASSEPATARVQPCLLTRVLAPQKLVFAYTHTLSPTLPPVPPHLLSPRFPTPCLPVQNEPLQAAAASSPAPRPQSIDGSSSSNESASMADSALPWRLDIEDEHEGICYTEPLAPNWQRRLYLPSTADAFVVAYRLWLDRYGERDRDRMEPVGQRQSRHQGDG